MPLHEWDARHAEALASGAAVVEASALVREFAEALPPGRALDLACGLGRHTLWLARKGWHVTAIDQSRVAIEFLHRAAMQERVPIHAAVADLEAGGVALPEHRWDLIVMYNYFQRDLVAAVKRATTPGGLVLASACLAGRFRAEPGELRESFADWEVLRYTEAGTRHGSAEIAARKP